MSGPLRIGTRRSPLALWQAHHVAGLLRARDPSLEVTLVEISTQGDKILDVALAKVGGKGLFVKEIEEALLQKRVDLAVHSLKDMPALLPQRLTIGAVPEREDPRDALVSGQGFTFARLPKGARIGTSSLRRAAQIRGIRPDLEVVSIRGNVGTRLKKIDGELSAGVLALAGLRRLGLEQRVTEKLDPSVMLPAVGQGALAIEIRRDDSEVAGRVAALEHAETRMAVTAERAMLRTMGGGCQVPIAAHATLERGELLLRGLVAWPDGRGTLRGERRGKASDAEELGRSLGQELVDKGGREILDSLEIPPALPES